MNQKTVKLLRAYAQHTGQKKDTLKKWWNSLAWTEKTVERRRIKSELTSAE